MDATSKTPSPTIVNEFPIRVPEAAAYPGVSPQTVYLWVERKQIPISAKGTAGLYCFPWEITSQCSTS